MMNSTLSAFSAKHPEMMGEGLGATVNRMIDQLGDVENTRMSLHSSDFRYLLMKYDAVMVYPRRRSGRVKRILRL